MQKRILLACSLLAAAVNVQSANIAIIDASGDAAHLSTISDKILFEKCFSESEPPEVLPGNIGADPTISRYYNYTITSACPGEG